jgi:hypothetical protein
MRACRVAVRALAMMLVSGGALAGTAQAQGDPPVGGNGFLFFAPAFELTVRLGYARAMAQSDVFSDATRQLTLGRGDFSGAGVAFDLSYLPSSRWEWVLTAEFTQRTAGSEYRDWTGSDGLPIAQQTRFTRAPMLLGARWNLRPRGETVGRLAWLPVRVVPWIALQGGAMYYDFAQEGDFVDFGNGNAVFAGKVESEGFAPMAAMTVGVTWARGASWGIVTQVRYDYAQATLGRNFSGFQPIDLSGVSFTAGVAIH